MASRKQIDKSDLVKVVGGGVINGSTNHNETFVETKKATADKSRKQPKDLGVKRPIDKKDLAKIVGGLAGINHNETFVEL